MKFVCPYCTREIKPEMAELTGEWEEYRALAARLGDHCRLASEYAEHFRAASGRMTLKKKLQVLRAAARLLEDGRFNYGGKHYRADKMGVLQGLRITIDSTEPPLKNHNYLKAILSKKAEKLSAEGLTATEEQQREDNRRQARRPAAPEASSIDPEEGKRKARELAESLEGTP